MAVSAFPHENPRKNSWPPTGNRKEKQTAANRRHTPVQSISAILEEIFRHRRAMPSFPPLLKTSLSDFFSPPILLRVLLPLAAGLAIVATAGVWLAGLLWTTTFHAGGADYSIQSLNQQADVALAGVPLVGPILVFIVVKVLFLLLSVVGAVVGFYALVLVALLITSFLTPGIVAVVHARHYPQCTYHGFGNIFHAISRMTALFLLYGLLFLLTLPLLFVPLINIVTLNLLLYGLFRQSMVFDVGSTICAPADYARLTGIGRRRLLALSAGLYGLSLIPLLNLAVPIYGVVVLSHYFFQGVADTEDTAPPGGNLANPR